MTAAAAPVLQALLRAAMDMTGAACGFVLRAEGDVLRVAAAVGDGTAGVVGRELAAGEGLAGYVVESQQPIALRPSGDDPRLGGDVAGLLAAQPSSVLCVPCATDDDLVGALELLDSAAGQFTLDDVEFATALADIAGAALTSGHDALAHVVSPDDLAGELERLSVVDPERYATVATVVAALLARG